MQGRPREAHDDVSQPNPKRTLSTPSSSLPHRLFDALARHDPLSIALTVRHAKGAEVVSYGRLEKCSAAVAAMLTAHGVTQVLRLTVDQVLSLLARS